MRLRAAICAAFLMGVLAAAAAAPATIEARGTVETGIADQLVCGVDQRYGFPVIIETMAPEWSHVEEGQVVVRLHRSPLLDVEKGDAEAELQVAHAEEDQAEATAASSVAKLEAQVADAQSALAAAQQQLKAVEQEPLPIDQERLALQTRENASRRTFTTVRLNLLAGLQSFGLCSDAEMESARHDLSALQAQAGYLAALNAELKPDQPPPDLLAARAGAKEADLELQAAELRRQTEADRQALLCEATRSGRLGKAQATLELVDRKIDALNVRAPRAGYLQYGTRWEPGLQHEKLAPGDTAWFGWQLAEIVDPAQMRIRAHVDEQQMPRLRVGDAVEVRLAAVPGRAYAGTISAILATVSSNGDQTDTGVGSVGERRGTVLVALSGADATVRPGMTATLTIVPSGAPQSALETAEPADPDRDLLLQGQVGSQTNHIVCAPFAGRVRWATDAGTQIEAGDTILTLDPGLEQDWRQADQRELKRLDLERQAAALSVDLADKVAPLVRGASEQKVRAAQVKLDGLQARPLASERLNAQSALDEELYQSQRADARLDVYKALAGRGMASAADVARYDLQAKLARAQADSARAELDRTLRGTSAPDLAVARAELDLANAELEVAATSAREDAALARANLTAAEAALDTYRKQADRRIERAGSADVVSPVRGVLIWCREPGDQMEKGWWLAAVAENSRPIVYAALNECDLPRVSEGMSAQVELAGLPGRTLTGSVTAIEDWPESQWRTSADRSTGLTGRLFQVVVKLDEQPSATFIGMSAQVRIRTAAPATAAAQVNHG